jgi:hypothetical protein
MGRGKVLAGRAELRKMRFLREREKPCATGLVDFDAIWSNQSPNESEEIESGRLVLEVIFEIRGDGKPLGKKLGLGTKNALLDWNAC